LQFDASRLTGSLVATLGARPAIGANLMLNRINLEAYLPRAARTPPATNTPSAAPANSAPSPPWEWLTAVDANLQLRIDQLSYNTLPLQGVLVEATLEQSTLRLHELSADDIAGVRATIGGVVRRARWPAEAELTVTAQGSDPSRLLELLGWDGASAALGPLTLSLGVTGPLDRLHVVLDGELAGAAVRAAGDLDAATPGALTLSSGTVAVHHDESLKLLRALFPLYRPAADALGPFELSATVGAGVGKLAVSDATLKLGPAAFTGRASVDLSKPRPELTVGLNGAALVLDPLLARAASEAGLGAALWSGVVALPATFGVPPSWDASASLTLGELDWRRHSATGVALDVALHERGARLDRLSGTAWGGTAALSGTLESGREPALALRLALTDVAAGAAAEALLGVAGFDGKADLELTVSAGGVTERDLRASLAGKGKLALRDGSVPGFDLAALAARLSKASGDGAAAVTQDLSRGRTAIARGAASLDVRGPRLTTEDGAASGPGGAIAVQGGVDLAARQVDLAVQLRAAGDAALPAARLRLTGALGQPVSALDVQELVGWLAARHPAPAASQPASDARRR
ncbi:MAG: hypothetical protein JO021_21495, partial [Alphaproteobacteria bacterium]|nr:hypothetical protein [Alphaproteobacteria bacterium]